MFTIDNRMGETLGQRIKNLRLARGWSLRQLGSRAELSGAYIHQLEAGKRVRPNIELVGRIAAAFGVSLDTLVGGNEVEEPLVLHENGVEYEIARQVLPNTDPTRLSELIGYWVQMTIPDHEEMIDEAKKRLPPIEDVGE